MSYSAETRRVCYDCGDEFGLAVFVPVCETCGRFVKADDTLDFKVKPFDDYEIGFNATCSKCGRIKMLFEGFQENESS